MTAAIPAGSAQTGVPQIAAASMAIASGSRLPPRPHAHFDNLFDFEAPFADYSESIKTGAYALYLTS